MLSAILFDCDGVLVDNERDGHRVAFNRAFRSLGLGCEWDVELYGELLAIAGGKERMRHYFDTIGWPESVSDREAFIKELHRLKTDHYMAIIESGELPLRPGVARLVDEAIAEGITVAVCSTSNERAVHAIIDKLLGKERESHFSVFTGDIVSKKKPDPAIYNLAVERLGYDRKEYVVIEDNRNGLQAARAAGLHCIVTTNDYTVHEDFTGADRIVPELGDPPHVYVTVSMIETMSVAW